MTKFKNGDRVRLLIDHEYKDISSKERVAKHGEYAVVWQVSKITGALAVTQFIEESNEKVCFWIAGNHVEAA